MRALLVLAAVMLALPGASGESAMLAIDSMTSHTALLTFPWIRFRLMGHGAYTSGGPYFVHFDRARITKATKGGSGAHVRSFLRYKAEEWAGFPHRMLTLISQTIPEGLRIRYHAEDLFWALYRKRA